MFLIKKTRSNTQHTSFAIFVSARQKNRGYGRTDGPADRRTDGQILLQSRSSWLKTCVAFLAFNLQDSLSKWKLNCVTTETETSVSFFKCRPLAVDHYLCVWAHLKAYSKTMLMKPGAYSAAILLLPLFLLNSVEKSLNETALKFEVIVWYQYDRL